MKTIKPHQVDRLTFDGLKAGMVVSEGVILEVYEETRLIYTAGEDGPRPIWVPPGTEVAVLARITDDMLHEVQAWVRAEAQARKQR